jgi:hypothetical protein
MNFFAREIHMNDVLESLAASIQLSALSNEKLRLTYGYICVKRVQHLLECQDVIRCFDILRHYLQGRVDHASLVSAAEEAACLANQHEGSQSIDGCGHAAVSASYAVANALSGRALQAASYAAYATVYASGGYGAIVERESFRSEFEWQSNTLKTLASNASLLELINTEDTTDYAEAL